MNDTVKVRAAAGLLVPMAGKPNEYINDQEPVDVPRAAYYLRCIDYGDLVVVEETKPAKGGK